jgi:hypothetical protein
MFRKAKQGADLRKIHNSTGYLSSAEFRAFWFSWANYNISLGFGSTVGQNVIFSYDDSGSSPDITSIALSGFHSITINWIYYDGMYT